MKWKRTKAGVWRRGKLVVCKWQRDWLAWRGSEPLGKFRTAKEAKRLAEKHV